MVNTYILAYASEQEIDFSSLINITAFLVFFGIALAVTVSLAFWAYIFIVQFLKDKTISKENKQN